MKFRQLARNYTFRKRFLSIYANELQFLERLELMAAFLYTKSRLMKDLRKRRKYRLYSLKLLMMHILICMEPENAIARPVDNKRTIQSFSDSDCKTFFGFNCQLDLLRILKCLRLNQDRVILSNRSVMTGEEVTTRFV